MYSSGVYVDDIDIESSEEFERKQNTYDSKTVEDISGRSATYDSVDRFLKNKGAVIGFFMILLIVLFAFVGPFLEQSDRDIFEFLSNVNEDVFGTFLGIDGEDEISGQTVSGGNVVSISGGHVHLVNDCRFNVSETSAKLSENIKKTASENSFDVVFNSVKEPFFVDQGSPILGILKNAYQDYTGEEATFPIGKGGTYAGKLPNAIATGICKRKYTDFPDGIKPGHGSVHQPDECMPIEGYFEGIKLLAILLIELDKISTCFLLP